MFSKTLHCSVNLYGVTVSVQQHYTLITGGCEVRIPASTSYGDKIRIEDIPGYALCTQCVNCTLTRPSQIVDDGKWYCRAFGKWYDGVDIITYRCKNFRMKTCSQCRQKRRCRTPHENSRVAWCNNFIPFWCRVPSRYFVGRPTNSIKKLKDPISIQNEESFARERMSRLEKQANASQELYAPEWWEKTAIDDTSDGVAEKGESEEVPTGDAPVRAGHPYDTEEADEVSSEAETGTLGIL